MFQESNDQCWDEVGWGEVYVGDFCAVVCDYVCSYEAACFMAYYYSYQQSFVFCLSCSRVIEGGHLYCFKCVQAMELSALRLNEL